MSLDDTVSLTDFFVDYAFYASNKLLVPVSIIINKKGKVAYVQFEHSTHAKVMSPWEAYSALVGLYTETESGYFVGAPTPLETKIRFTDGIDSLAIYRNEQKKQTIVMKRTYTSD